MQEQFSAVRVGGLGPLIRSGRPALLATFHANYVMAGGFEPLSFHVTNVLLHGLNAGLLFFFLRALFAGRSFGDPADGFRPLFVYFLPLLFLTSPIQTESVAYVSSRSELLGTTFYLCGLWAFVAYRETHPWRTAALAILCFAGAAASKQDKITLPAAILLLDYLLLSKRDWRGLAKSWPTYGLFGLGMILGFLAVVRPVLFAQSAGFTLDWQPYLFTQLRIIFRYLGQLVAPWGLNLDPDIAISQSLWQHFSWLALIGLILLIVVAWKLRRRAPLASFGLLFFLLALAPTTSFVPLLDYAAERRLYLPSIGFFLAALTGAAALVPARSKGLYVAAAALAAVYSYGTYQRSVVWSDELLLWQDTASKSPKKARPWGWVGRLYNERGEPEKALAAWQRAAEVVERGSDEEGYLLSNIALGLAELDRRQQAIEYYQRSLDILPDDPRIRAQLAVQLIRTGREEEGWRELERAFSNPDKLTPELYVLRGQEHYLAGRYDEALRDFEQADFMRPGDPDLEHNLEVARRAAAEAGAP